MSDNRLGVPYQGSKNKIAKQIVSFLPPAIVFVDAFCGGCAVTHGAMLTRKFGRILCNDIDDTAQTLFKNAIEGMYHDETRWVSRGDFKALKDSDPYVGICWSFGNNRTQYMYAEKLEPWKKALHHARVFKDYSLLREMGIEGDGSSKDVLRHNEEYKAKYIQWWLRQQQYSIDDLEELKRECKDYNDVVGLRDLWQRLQSLERLERVTFTSMSYDQLEIPDGAVVYCDPPYKGTNCVGYVGGFDHSKFYDWCEELSKRCLVFISEYDMPSDRFECVLEIKKQNLYCSTVNKQGVERLFVPKGQRRTHAVQLTLF